MTIDERVDKLSLPQPWRRMCVALMSAAVEEMRERAVVAVWEDLLPGCPTSQGDFRCRLEQISQRIVKLEVK